EVNLWDKDITNMRVAEKVNAATYLIADIDKGGVFASVYGTIQLLPESQRNLIKGIIINKFRGDIQLFTEGRKILEELTGKPVVGVIPHFRDIFVEQEDSVVLDSATTTSKKGLVNVAVVLLKHMSNFTDFNLLEQHPNVHLYYTANPMELEQADIIIIPGSKNTIADLMHIRENNLAKVIVNHHLRGKPVYGICGGYQIMGKELHDPYGIEGDTQFIPGLGILPTVTTISTEKKTVQCNFKFLDLPDDCTGYEIHMGQTVSEKSSPLCIISGNEPDGYFLNPSTWGTYIHGIFDNGAVVENILNLVGVKAVEKLDFRQYKEENYNKLANLVRENIDLEYIYSTLQND
ncbi:MAG: cobyric acid synthase, partial [Candidatus Riflebacteria bacterium]